MLGFASAIVDTNALWKIIVASLAGLFCVAAVVLGIHAMVSKT